MLQSEDLDIYQLRVYLRQISPAIWRRLLVRSDSTIADLHYTLQIAMDWSDFHLHQFTIRGKHYGVEHIGGVHFSDDADQVKLRDFSFRDKERFLYEYDFGDLWQHEIRLEKRCTLDPQKTYPLCIGGARGAPPEDCGGPWTFMALEQHYSSWALLDQLLDVLDQEGADVCYEELRRIQEWVERSRFDRRAVNRRLKLYATGDKAWLQL